MQYQISRSQIYGTDGELIPMVKASGSKGLQRTGLHLKRGIEDETYTFLKSFT